MRQNATSRTATGSRDIYPTFILRNADRFGYLVGLRSSFRTITRVRLCRRYRVLANDFRRFIRTRFRGTRPILRTATVFIFPVVNVKEGGLTSRVTIANVCFRYVRSNFTHRVGYLSRHFYRDYSFKEFRSASGNEKVSVRATKYKSEPTPTSIFIERISTVSRLCKNDHPFFISNVNSIFWSKSSV